MQDEFTITIPTVEELETLINGLLLYRYIDIEFLDLDKAILKLNNNINVREVKRCYVKIRELLSNYTLSTRGKL